MPPSKKRKVATKQDASRNEPSDLSESSLAGSAYRNKTLHDFMNSNVKESPIASLKQRSVKSYDSKRGDELPESSSEYESNSQQVSQEVVELANIMQGIEVKQDNNRDKQNMSDKR